MRRNRLLLLLALVVVVVIVVVYLLGVAGAILVVLRLPTPKSPIAEPRSPPPVVESRKPPLQADAEGYYVPGYPFTVNGFRFIGFTLRPEALVTFGQTTVACTDAKISAQDLHLRCDDPQLGTVTIDGKFLTRLVTSRLDAAVVSAVVTVRDATGEILYRARDSFEWHPGN